MATTLSHSKQQLVRQALTQMQSSLADSTWTVREKLALTCRILFDHGHDSGLAGQISLSHHGQLSTGASVEQACVYAQLIERAARLQLLAMAAGTIKPITPALGREAHDWIDRPKRHTAAFNYYARQCLRKHEDCLN